MGTNWLGLSPGVSHTCLSLPIVATGKLETPPNFSDLLPPSPPPSFNAPLKIDHLHTHGCKLGFKTYCVYLGWHVVSNHHTSCMVLLLSLCLTEQGPSVCRQLCHSRTTASCCLPLKICVSSTTLIQRLCSWQVHLLLCVAWLYCLFAYLQAS